MWVTCYTDASYSRRGGGTWAAWLRGPDSRLVRRGQCPRWIRDSVGAELAAIFAGVYLAVTRFGATGVFVRSDCQGALDLAKPDAQRARRPEHAKLQGRLRELSRARTIALDLRWTPGHRTGTSAAFLNGACDRLARALRREVIDQKARERHKEAPPRK
jgi:ribonuclease HI